MKGLIIRQPWLDLILSGQKVYEMRSKRTNIRGKIGLIQAGSSLVLGTCTLVDCNYLTPSQLKIYYEFHKVNPSELSFLDYKWAWYLQNVKRFKEPIPYTHPRGAVVWVNLPSEVVE